MICWVRQEDAQGCGLATLAMITGRSYADVKATINSWADWTEHDWADGGCTHYALDRFLAGSGWFIQRRYGGWAELPLRPFAPIHYASVAQPSGRNHFVVVLSDGDVLDPLREGRYRLDDWPKVNQVVGLAQLVQPY